MYNVSPILEPAISGAREKSLAETGGNELFTEPLDELLDEPQNFQTNAASRIQHRRNITEQEKLHSIFIIS